MRWWGLSLVALAGACALAFGDETFQGKDGAVWTVHADAREEGGDHESRKFHVLLDGREVGTFVESAAVQTNPRMSISTSYTFRVDKAGALIATATYDRRLREHKHGPAADKIEHSVIDYVWNGIAFVEAAKKKK